MNGDDTVRSATINPAFAAGTFTWNIPWYLRVAGSREEKIFTYAAHSEVCDAAGNMTISKKGATCYPRRSRPRFESVATGARSR